MRVKTDEANAIAREKDPGKKEALYQIYVLRFPENSADPESTQEGLKLRVAAAYLNNGDLKNFYRFEEQLKDKSNLIRTLNNVAYSWAQKDTLLNDAAALSKQSLDLLKQKIDHPVGEMYASAVQVKRNNERTYDEYADTHAYILFKMKRFGEAVAVEQPIIDHKLVVDSTLYEHYIQMLMAVQEYGKALTFAEFAIKSDIGTATTKGQLKVAYQKVKSDTVGFQNYLASLERLSQTKARDEVAKTMIDQPSPAFSLRDLDGKVVNLKDLKGKIVIIDFWATWCVPCKASFPGMQLAVNKYRSDPNVIFLFIDTYERTDNYRRDVKKYMTDNNYQFKVILDDKNVKGKQGKVVVEYAVDGIPTKFVIDGNGHIRFKYVGYSGTPEKLLSEVVDMVELTKKQSATH